MSVDPAIIEALQLDPANTKIASHGGAGFSSTFKLSSSIDGSPINYFVKTGTGKDSDVMFKGMWFTSCPATRPNTLDLRT